MLFVLNYFVLFNNTHTYKISRIVLEAKSFNKNFNIINFLGNNGNMGKILLFTFLNIF